MNLTTKEKAVLAELKQSKSHAPALGVDEMALTLNESQDTIKGVVGSLKKKGLVGQMDVNGTHSVTYITDEGEQLMV